jgi:hypothetical protein
MKVKKIEVNNRKRLFEVSLKNGKEYTFPFSQLDIKPVATNKIASVEVDKEIASEGFSYLLEDGSGDTILVDQVLAFHCDPEYQLQQTLYNLTLALKSALSESTLSKRQLAELLGTSLSQLERLLDQTNYKKSANSLIKALGYLSRTVEISAA